MDGAEAGGRREQHDIAAVDDLLVRVDADELVVLIDSDLFGDPVVRLEVAQAAVDLSSKHVGDGDELHLRVGRERLLRRTGPASPASDQSHLELIASRRKRASIHRQVEAKRSCHSRSGFQKITTRSGRGRAGFRMN